MATPPAVPCDVPGLEAAMIPRNMLPCNIKRMARAELLCTCRCSKKNVEAEEDGKKMYNIIKIHSDMYIYINKQYHVHMYVYIYLYMCIYIYNTYLYMIYIYTYICAYIYNTYLYMIYIYMHITIIHLYLYT